MAKFRSLYGWSANLHVGGRGRFWYFSACKSLWLNFGETVSALEAVAGAESASSSSGAPGTPVHPPFRVRAIGGAGPRPRSRLLHHPVQPVRVH
ncbi:unnamed protein product [Caenorhabditis brenneri]